MPYTPPAQQSPESSKTTSPRLSRSSSYGTAASPLKNAGSLPRSASYLLRHRRTQSVVRTNDAVSPGADGGLKHTVSFAGTDGLDTASASQLPHHASLRQSPPPIIDTNIMPAGAVISPPDSGGNSSDDEGETVEDRPSRQLENLAELKEAIRGIGQRREWSPTRGIEQDLELAIRSRLPADAAEDFPGQPGQTSSPAPTATTASSDSQLAQSSQLTSLPDSTLSLPTKIVTVETVPFPSFQASASPEPLSPGARKFAHSRSATESSFLIDRKNSKDESAITPSDEDDEDVLIQKRRIPMVRKKSGELVKPALKPGSARARPSSMPSTPTYPKAVHFDSHLEHIRHFLQVDKPLAVSAGSSPVDTYDSETEFPLEMSRSVTPPFEWEIVLPNFPSENAPRQSTFVRVERVFLSPDNKNLVGTVAVANIAFQKWVVARFTTDYWKTVSEVSADFNPDPRRKHINDGYDRFNFSIKLADLTNLENKTLFFCVRYSVNGAEHWDSNGSTNFQVEFRKKHLPQNGKNGVTSAKSKPLPHSRPGTVSNRPLSMPPSFDAPSFDDFSDGFDTKYDFSVFRNPQVGRVKTEPPTMLRMKNGTKGSSKAAAAAVIEGTDSGEVPPPRTKATGQAFGNRYDFGASLNAAISAANNALGDRSGIKMKASQAEPKTAQPQGNYKVSLQKSASWIVGSPTFSPSPISFKSSHLSASNAAPPQRSFNTGGRTDTFGSDKPPLQSTSYNELIDKYCFVRAKSTRSG
jgi:hypothetical protein